MMDTEALRKKVIDLAIQGKLTQQLPEDGNAEDLYAQIQKKKAKLIEVGKIKKEKPLSEISDEVPFEIPKNWKWIRFNELGVFGGGKTPSMSNSAFWTDGIIPWITSKDMKQKYISTSQMLISECASKTMTIYPSKSILFVVRSGILKRMFPVAIALENTTINQDLKALRLHIPEMCEYVYYVLKGLESIILFKYAKEGTTVNNINFDSLLFMPIPLPPLEEQKRIVSVIETAINELDTVEALQQKYESDREILKEKIIDAGIRGKLTEQLPEDGNAEDLYARIQKEKAKLIKEGKIKKEKPLPEIFEEEIPFEIPANWKWVRFLDAVRNISSRDHQITTSELSETGNYAAISQGMVFIDGYSNEEDKVIWNIPLVLFGDHTRNVKYIDFPFIVCADGTQLLQFIDCDNKYFYYWTKSVVNQMSSRGYARHFSLLKKSIIPLPPLAEQTRIASRIEEIFTLLGI